MLDLQFPSEWRVHYRPMKGHTRQSIQRDRIKEAFRNPIGSKTVGQLAKTRKEAVIMFDDMARVTRSAEIVPYIIEELNTNGISNDHIRFICALGAHGTCDRADFVKKLGEDIVEQFPVYNHNAFSNLTHLGKTSRGTPIQVNSEVMACDLKIGLGSVVPHPGPGFGGGGKIILPGVSSMESMAHNHGDVCAFANSQLRHSSVGWGKVEGNIMRLDIEEAARAASLDIKLDVLFNGYGDTTDVFVGDFVAEHRAAVELGRKIYATDTVENADIVIANTYAKVNEAANAVISTVSKVKKDGTLVVVANAPDGQVTHYLFGKFGRKSGGPLYPPSFPAFSRIIVFSPYQIADPLLPIAEQDLVIWRKKWSEVIEMLKAAHPGHPTVAVYPHADIQIDEKTSTFS
jgi:nickel-dependent lactate racemase